MRDEHTRQESALHDFHRRRCAGILAVMTRYLVESASYMGSVEKGCDFTEEHLWTLIIYLSHYLQMVGP